MRIHIFEDFEPEKGYAIVTFRLEEGEFSGPDLWAAQKVHVESKFEFRDKSVISVWLKTKDLYPQIPLGVCAYCASACPMPRLSTAIEAPCLTGHGKRLRGSAR